MVREEPSPHWEIIDQCLFLCLWPTHGSGHESKSLREFQKTNNTSLITGVRHEQQLSQAYQLLEVALSHIPPQLRRSCFHTFQIQQLGCMLVTVLSYFWVNF